VTISGEVKHCNFTQEAGTVFETTFCPNCGSTICKTTNKEELADFYIIEGGTINEGFSELTKPMLEIFTKHRAGWVGEVAGAKQIDENP